MEFNVAKRGSWNTDHNWEVVPLSPNYKYPRLWTKEEEIAGLIEASEMLDDDWAKNG